MRIINIENSEGKTFSKILLEIGNGINPHYKETYDIQLHPKFCQLVSSLTNLINEVYPNLKDNYKNPNWLLERAILAPKNEDVEKINHQIQNKIPGKTTKYLSINTVIDVNQSVNYPIEFLNSLEPQGMLPHLLKLKVGSPIMVLRN